MDDVLNRLEEKTRRVAKTLTALRRDNLRLTRELQQAQQASTSRTKKSGSSPDEARVRLLEEERVTVRRRVEKLIALLEDSP